MLILLHSSKTMRQTAAMSQSIYQSPTFLDDARTLISILRNVDNEVIQKSMKLSEAMTTQTRQLINEWTDSPRQQLPAIDAFLGDIYSGLQVQAFDDNDRNYANTHLYILSGLYGALRALDGIYPYRLEMGYRFHTDALDSMYTFWGTQIAKMLPSTQAIVNLSAIEYTKALLPYIDPSTQIITPKFFTVSPKNGRPTFVTVHTKIARGAFAHWLIKQRITQPDTLQEFTELGYAYNADLSTDTEPAFVCQTFKGIGLSVRLS